MSKLKSIAFQSTEVALENLLERLRKMTDDELITFGKMVRRLAEPRVLAGVDPWLEQLRLAREEWRRRHPKGEKA